MDRGRAQKGTSYYLRRFEGMKVDKISTKVQSITFRKYILSKVPSQVPSKLDNTFVVHIKMR